MNNVDRRLVNSTICATELHYMLRYQLQYIFDLFQAYIGSLCLWVTPKFNTEVPV